MTNHSDTPRNCPAHFGMHEIPCPIGCKDICARAQPLEMNKLVSALTAQLAEARRDAEIGAAIEKAARDLPEYYELEITVERGAASVYLRNPDGETSCIDKDSDNRLAAEINEAIDAAIAKEKK